TGVLLKAQEELKRARQENKEMRQENKEKDKKLEAAQQKNKNIAKELKFDGMPTEKISKLTGLSINEIEKL
ncbi:MAG: hypothetical protein FWF51_08185, partial [Chitinivibrionia bacterium]|nr:hypothetical protein [Chitinivibrionia bacterium]